MSWGFWGDLEKGFILRILVIRFITLELNGVLKGFEILGVDNFGENSEVLINGGTEGVWLGFGVWKVVFFVIEYM